MYQSRWTVFLRWCKKNKRSSSRADVIKVSEFLCYLFNEKKLSVPSIKGYRSVLANVFRHSDQDFTNNRDLHDLIRAFELESNSRRTITTPNWDLDIVLKALTQKPYEPLCKASFRSLTKKTLFLLSLATAKRIGEIQGVSKLISYKGENAILEYLPEFHPKTDRPENPVPRDYEVKALSTIVGRYDEERLLCPVRALRYYLQETNKLEMRPRNLFVALRKKEKPISKNGISYLLRETIKEAHISQPTREYPRGDIRAHSIRGIATSLNFMKNKSFTSVMEAATWRGNSIFVSHYLKDVSRTYEHCSSLGSIIAAGTVV